MDLIYFLISAAWLCFIIYKKQVKGAVHQSSGMPLTCFFYMIFYNQAVEMQTLLTAPNDRP